MEERDRLKARQITFYSQDIDMEGDITRPRGYPLPVQFLLDFKINNALKLLKRPLSELSALVICGGSGMDAEKLERHGLRVLVTDLSQSAVGRAKERAKRYGLYYQFQVADAERLPFKDSSFDIVFVHDGLHHLLDPYIAIREMARVARQAVVIIEPQDEALTKLAIKLGISGNWEPAGNYVYRLCGPDLASYLAKLGFPNAAWRGHVIYYKQWTIPIYNLLNREPFLSLFKSAFYLSNALVGRWGNSLKFAAWRA